MTKPKKSYDRALSGGTSLDQRVYYWQRDENGERRAMKCGYYLGLRRLWPQVMTDQDRAKFVVDCRDLIQAVKVANGADLQEFSDQARLLITEIPSVIPPHGFVSYEKIRFPDCLSAEEIECKLKGELDRLGLLSWLELWDAQVKQ